MNTDTMFSSEDGRWETPEAIVSHLRPLFPWDIDVCAERPNVCDRYFSPDDNGLAQEWSGLCWMNPPYGRQIGHWLSKARRSTAATVVCLIPARTDTRWWRRAIRSPSLSLVTHIAGRLTFGSDEAWLAYWQELGKVPYNSKGIIRKNAAPFPSAFMVFGRTTQQQNECLAEWGGYTLLLHDNRGDNKWTHRRAELLFPATD